MDYLDDESPMPFGKHKNKRMADVPARWLIDYYHDYDVDKLKDAPIAERRVLQYIKEAKSVLEHEAAEALFQEEEGDLGLKY